MARRFPEFTNTTLQGHLNPRGEKISNPLICTPDRLAIAQLRENWSWLVSTEFKPELFSIFGDVFYPYGSNEVFWLNTGTAEVTLAAKNWDSFHKLLRSENAEDWFMPDLVEALHAEGKIPGSGRCYTYLILPIFEGGDYETWNFTPVPTGSHFGLTGHIHARIAVLPDAASVQLTLAP